MTIITIILLAIVVTYGFTVFFGAPYIPAKTHDVEVAFEKLYTLTTKDTLLDLGSGDGKVLRIAANHGAKAVGYELHPLLVWISQIASRGLSVTTKLANMWRTSFPADTTVVYIFSDSRDIARLTHLIENEATRLNRTLVVISYGFNLPGYEPVKTAAAHHLFYVAPLHKKKA
ncbi:MAG: hypothetical protein ACSLEY_00785 [Candidatus Saccharimonadales bacterium]